MPGLFGSVAGMLKSAGNILDSGLGLIQTRVELLSAELQEERVRFFRTILCAAALVTVGVMTLILFTATIIFAFSESLRLAAAGGLTVVYAFSTVVLYRKLHNQIHKNRPLSGTLDEIKRDREAFRARN